MIDVKVKTTRRGPPPMQNPKAEIGKWMHAEAHRLRAMMIDGIDSQGGGTFRKISPWTAAARRFVGRKGSGLKGKGTKALVASGTMRKAIKVRDIPGGKAIGIARSAPGGANKPARKLALIHEFGAVSRPTVTLKMLAYIFGVLLKALRGHGKAIVNLWRKGRIGRPGTAWGLRVGKQMTIVIPARPFLQPAYVAWLRQLPRGLFEFWKVHGF